MMVFLVTLAAFALAVLAMAVGAMVTGRRLSGSCGGVSGSACACSPEKRAACKEQGASEGPRPPIQASTLTRAHSREG